MKQEAKVSAREDATGVRIFPSAVNSADFIGSSLGGLDRALADLVEKLQPLLTPNPPATAQGAPIGQPDIPCSDLTAALDGHARYALELTSNIRHLIERIEL